MSKQKCEDLRRWRRFNRNSKIKYHDSDKWRWELTDSEKVMYKAIQEKFDQELKINLDSTK